MNVLGLRAKPRLEQAPRRIGRRGIARLLGLAQVVVGIPGKLRVDGKPHRGAVLARNAHGKLHALRTTGHRRHVLGILGRRQHLAKDGTQLHLAHDAARLDVGEHPLEVSHTLGKPLHLAKTTVHLLEARVDTGERARELLAQLAPELVVHRRAHDLGAACVLDADALEASLVLGAHGLEAARRLRPQLRHLVGELGHAAGRLRELDLLQLPALRELALEHGRDGRRLGQRRGSLPRPHPDETHKHDEHRANHDDEQDDKHDQQRLSGPGGLLPRREPIHPILPRKPDNRPPAITQSTKPPATQTSRPPNPQQCRRTPSNNVNNRPPGAYRSGGLRDLQSK